jgi:hypothetical protein
LPTWQLMRVTLRWELRPLSVSNGCSGRKMYSPGSSVGPITEGARSRRPFGSPIIKTGAVVLHPLEDRDGTPFYADAEVVLAKVPRRGIPMIMHEDRKRPEVDKPKQAVAAWPSWCVGCARLQSASDVHA